LSAGRRLYCASSSPGPGALHQPHPHKPRALPRHRQVRRHRQPIRRVRRGAEARGLSARLPNSRPDQSLLSQAHQPQVREDLPAERPARQEALHRQHVRDAGAGGGGHRRQRRRDC